jgi:hypothetical protein
MVMTEQNTDKKTLGISFMILGLSLAITFGLTLGWQFAPIGVTFLVMGTVFMAQDKDSAE